MKKGDVVMRRASSLYVACSTMSGEERTLDMLVFGEQCVKDAKGRLEIAVDDVLGASARLLEAGLLHQAEGEVDVVNFMGE